MADHCHHCQPGIPPFEIEVDLDELLERCRAKGMRRTYLLRRVLARMAKQAGPVSIPCLLADEALAETGDAATLYRLMDRLEAQQIVRRVGLHERAAHYYLNLPNRHRDFLVCVDCGTVEVLKLSCPVGDFDEEVARDTGFKGVYHELQFYGHCATCQAAGAA